MLQLDGPIKLRFRQLLVCLGLFKLGTGQRIVELNQNLSRLDRLPFLEIERGDAARLLGTHDDRLIGAQTAYCGHALRPIELFRFAQFHGRAATAARATCRGAALAGAAISRLLVAVSWLRRRRWRSRLRSRCRRCRFAKAKKEHRTRAKYSAKHSHHNAVNRFLHEFPRRTAQPL